MRERAIPKVLTNLSSGRKDSNRKRVQKGCWNAKLLVFGRLLLPDTVLVTMHALFCTIITLALKNRWFGYYQ